jgi:DNA-binding transcriptional ArsR family regulator
VAKVTLDLETFKALASETRLNVLRALDERRKTLSELSREMDLNKATVHEHLQLLAATGLVTKKDEGRKWIYWELSWRGQRLLHPQETTTFSILLGLSIAAAGGGVVVLGRALQWWLAERPLVGLDADPTADDLQAAPADDQEASQPASSPESGQASDTSPSPEYASDQGNQTSEELLADEDSSSLSSDLDFIGDGGVFAILMLVTSLLLATIAWASIRFRRKV